MPNAKLVFYKIKCKGWSGSEGGAGDNILNAGGLT